MGENKEMPSVRAKMVSGLFKMLGVNKMLDKQSEEFDKLLEKYKVKQKKPLKVPYKKMKDFNIDTESINGTTCYVISKKGAASQNAVLYLFGGGYILPPDPGDIILCGQMAENCGAKVWFPLYPMAPEHRLVETLQSTLQVYRNMLEEYDASHIRFFGTSSGGGQVMSLCVYIRHENIKCYCRYGKKQRHTQDRNKYRYGVSLFCKIHFTCF